MGDFALSLDGYVSPDNQLTDVEEVDPFATHYSQLGLRFGVELKMDDDLPAWLKAGSFVGQVGYSRIVGDEGNRFSKRHQAEVLFGWKQKLFGPFEVTPKIGLGYAFNFNNFGRGYEPEMEQTLNGQGQLEVGVELCANPALCATLFGGYFYERSLVGQGPDYINQGPMIGVRLSGDICVRSEEIQP